MPKFQPDRAVEIVAPKYGSAYRIGGRLVLTCSHLFGDNNDCQVRSKSTFGVTSAKVIWKAPKSIDIALIELPAAIETYSSICFGSLPNSSSAEKVAFDFLGWPRWGFVASESETRATGLHIEGIIYVADISPDGLLILELKRSPSILEVEQAILEAKKTKSEIKSPWQGASGAAIVCNGLVVGVQRWHQNPDRPESLEAESLARVYDNQEWRELLEKHGIDPEPKPVISDTSDPSITPNNLELRGSDTFVGREAKLQELDDLLQRENRSAICALAGMGGIGKTELAVQYALRYQDSYLGGICWLQVRGADLGIQIVNYGRIYLGLTPPDGLELSQQVDYCWANWREGKVLIVFDDVDDYATIKPYFPPNQSRFKLVLTSRLKLLKPGERLDLDVLSPADSLKLLRAILGEEDRRIDGDLGQAEALCEWLGHLPLGLELVAHYLTEHPAVNFKTLQKRLAQKRLDAAPLLKDEQAEMTAQLGVAAAFELSWEDLAAKATEAQAMGCILSLFAPVAFNWSWVQQVYLDTDESVIAAWMALREDEAAFEEFLEQVSEQWQAEGKSQEDFEKWLEQKEEAIEQLETLRDSQLIKRHLLEAVEEGQYKQHPLIREFFQAKSAQIEKMDDYRQKFCEVMVAQAKLSPTPIQTEVLAVSPAIPHITEVAKGLNQWVREKDALWPFVGLARFYNSQNAYQEVESWYKRGLKAMRQRFGEEHPAVATSLNNLAVLYYAMGRYEAAEPYYQQSLAMWQKLLGEEHPDVASSLNNLAALYNSMGRYEAAEPYYQQSLAMRQKLLGEEHPDVATSLNNLAYLYYAMGEYEAAEPYYQQSLAMRQKLLGEEHPDVATSLNNLAALYDSMGRYEAAEPYYQQSLAMRQKLLGEEHPYIATSLNNLAVLYCAMGRYKAAEPYYQQSLAMRQKLLGEEHPYIATSFNNLAELYREMGRYEAAEPYYQQSLAMWQKLLGEAHPDVATSLNNLAALYESMGRYEAAEPYYQQSLAMRQKLLGEEHPDIAQSLNNLAGLYRAMGRYEEAIVYFQAAIALARKVLGDNHPYTQGFMDNFIQLLKEAPEVEVLRVLPEEMHPAIRQLRQ